MTLFLFNYDCEFEWANDPAQVANPQSPWAVLNAQAPILWPLMQPGDRLAVYGHPQFSTEFAEILGFVPELWPVQGGPTNRVTLDLGPYSGAICPWGWSPRALKLAGRPVDLTYKKLFSKTFDRPHPLAPPCHLVSGPETLPEALAQAYQDWGPTRVKHPLGSSGRLSAIYLGGPPPKAWFRWAKEGLILEKQLDLKAEWSLQFELEPEGPRFLGGTKLFTTRQGAHLGNWAGPMGGHLAPLEPTALALAQKVFKEGYLGPLGIDILETTERLYLGEINPRLTMGRLALEWSAKLGQPGLLSMSGPGPRPFGWREIFTESGPHAQGRRLGWQKMETFENL
ncbi:MAG: hypothetical protein A2527_07270 [Candidatus Lambdaproteobacteria bacterium RIFOXYD2_FULL_50_16]|uniref:ATP-grasp domain-containing protein n=1 Tax=Candidatus Lambdaproteobacteria bacterium RIFOXYD2_FULL_50_16 TaxID=1817772 RepID=A0A1F6GB27_9PROT|nr:MAG: hypothetical protein A2527_07270 [Candidatus Lambdaproteobacteria bacterium RIFOXYD2_FULL_50_16]